MTTTALMGMVLPDDGASLNVWGVILNTLLTSRVDLHNHTTGFGAKVPVAGIDVNADFSFSPSGTPRAITDLKAIDFAAVASSAVAGLAGAFFLSDGTGGLVNGELYYRTTGGSNVRVSNGAALNVAAFAGGIGGDYSTIGALLDYDDATDTYRFRQETAAAVRQFAKVQFADIKLIEYDPSGDASVPAAALTIRSPDALAGAYNLTMFTALPGSTQLVQLDSAGQLTASNTVANAVTLSGGVAGATNFAAAVTMATTLGVTGLITATAGATAALNQSFTVSGTGRFKHGTMTLPINAAAFIASVSTSVVSYAADPATGTSLSLRANIPLPVGKRITALRMTCVDSVTGPTTMRFQLKSLDSAGSAVLATSGASAGTGAVQTISLGSLTTTITAGVSYVLIVSCPTGTASVSLYFMEVDYDHP